MANDSEKLFLLEFLVDKVVLPKPAGIMERLNSQNDWGSGELCVTFQFLDYPHLEICEKDFTASKTEDICDDTKASFKSGKSCLFAVPSSQMEVLPQEFAVNVGVLRQMPAGVLPDKLLIAQTKIELMDVLSEIIREAASKCQDIPVSRTVKDCFCLMDPSGTKTVGSICVFVRLTCCGKAIVTHFQLGGETDQTALFKGNESDKVYQFRNVDGEESNATCHQMCPWLYLYHQQQQQQQQQQQHQSGCSCACMEPPTPPTCCARPCEVVVPPTCCGGGAGECFCADDASAATAQKPKLYEEIGAEINGHALTIRVKKDKKKRNDDDFDDMCCPSQDDACCEPAPANAKGSALEIRPYGIKDAAGFCLKFPQKGSQQLCYKLRGCPSENSSPPCGQCAAPGDYDQEAFVLRIAKDRKSHLEFELKTPKKVEPPPPITTENRETQCLASDWGKGNGKKKKSR